MSNTATIRTLASVVQEFRVIEPDLPASYAAIFLYVARHEHERGEQPSIADISNALGMTRPSTSRATLALSTRRLGGSKSVEDKADRGRKALGLIERTADEIDLRVMRCSLTQKGKGLLNRLIDHLGG